jgi:mono/diheme cytochrome c family protein
VSTTTPTVRVSRPDGLSPRGATNVAQIVISGTNRHTEGAVSMPAFGDAYSDAEIAAVANYVTARFGKGSNITAQNVTDLRKQTSQ